jgi:hypothetical protein
LKSTKGNIFGGYTSLPWSNSGGYKSDQTAFLFSLVNAQNNPVKMMVKTSSAISHNPSNGIYFGGGPDLCTGDNNGGYNNELSYQNPNGLLDGEKNFIFSEFETYQII